MSLGKTLARNARYAVFALAGCLVSMSISYIMVRHLTRDDFMVPPAVDRVTLHHAGLLRKHSNKLLTLTNEYVQRLPLEAGAPKPDTQQWIEQTFRPQIKRLKTVMLAENLVPAAIHQGLLDAAARANSMATHKEDSALRRNCVQETLLACQAVEEYLDGLNIERPLPEAPVKPRFRASD